jgi:L-ascorbate metabolism protein UlaG (beta-lactamase superfamily)
MVEIQNYLTIYLAAVGGGGAGLTFDEDTFETKAGELRITFLGHGTLMLTLGDKVIHVDPWNQVADYSTLPKADIVLITHEHHDHLDPQAVETIRKEATDVILTEKCAGRVPNGTVMRNGDVRSVKGLQIEAVPAYNIVHLRDEGNPFHPKGEGSGYVISFGDKRIYVAGDTENIPEMKALKGIDIAFLPANLPYTMSPEMVADAARALRPKVLYPYHFGATDTARIVDLLRDTKDIEVRIRKLS